MNIQDELQKIHQQYGTTEMANYEIQKLFDNQQERSYSEEDMRKAFEFYAERAICDIKYLDDDFNEFIKQLKKEQNERNT